MALMDTVPENFTSPTKGSLTIKEVIEEISSFVDEDPTKFYRIVIGSDSQAKRVNSHSEIDFVTAIVVHRQASCAIYFWRKQRIVKKPILREKIYTETQRSLEIAHDLVPELRKAISPVKSDFEIHIDVGPNGATRDMIKEVVGMVTGNGFTAKTKPESWGASSVADKHT